MEKLARLRTYLAVISVQHASKCDRTIRCCGRASWLSQARGNSPKRSGLKSGPKLCRWVCGFNGGDLVLKTAWGEFRHRRPRIYKMRNGRHGNLRSSQRSLRLYGTLNAASIAFERAGQLLGSGASLYLSSGILPAVLVF
jgi:hypothetical protein